MDGAMDQMDGQNDLDDTFLHKVRRPSLDIMIAISVSTKVAISDISSACWLCATEPYEVAHVLGWVDTSVLLLPRT